MKKELPYNKIRMSEKIRTSIMTKVLDSFLKRDLKEIKRRFLSNIATLVKMYTDKGYQEACNSLPDYLRNNLQTVRKDAYLITAMSFDNRYNPDPESYIQDERSRLNDEIEKLEQKLVKVDDMGYLCAKYSCSYGKKPASLFAEFTRTSTVREDKLTGISTTNLKTVSLGPITDAFMREYPELNFGIILKDIDTFFVEDKNIFIGLLRGQEVYTHVAERAISETPETIVEFLNFYSVYLSEINDLVEQFVSTVGALLPILQTAKNVGKLIEALPVVKELLSEAEWIDLLPAIERNKVSHLTKEDAIDIVLGLDVNHMKGDA